VRCASDEIPAPAKSRWVLEQLKEWTMTTERNDGMLVIQVLRWGTEMGVDDALATVFSADYDQTDMADPSTRKVLVFGETVGALIKHGLVSRELMLDIYWFDGMWDRVGHHALAARAQEGVPSLYENFEALVGRPPAV
jgi:hypothetical protein